MKRRKFIALGAATIAVVATAAITVVGIHNRRQGDASYMFNEGNFARVAPKMTPSQVRDLLGPPITREFGQDGTSLWKYSAMPVGKEVGGIATGVPEYTEMTVFFDPTGHVRGTGRLEVSQGIDPATGTYPLVGLRPPAKPFQLEHWPLPMMQGDAPVLGPDTSPVVIQIMASWCGPCGRERPLIEAMVNSQGNGCKLVLVSVDDDEAALKKYIKEHGIIEPVARLVSNTRLIGFDRKQGIPRYALLFQGWICWFDFESASNDPERIRDLDWFIRQRDLGQFGVNK